MINTFSGWIYGHDVTDLNQNIPFDDGSGEVNATVTINSYTFQDFATAIQSAMNSVGSQTYTVTIDRNTRFITISAAANFDLLITTGATVGADLFSLMGFTGANLTGANTYTSDSPSGFIFTPQLKLQRYVDFDDEQSAVAATVNESGDGTIDSVTFGLNKFMTCDVQFQHDSQNNKVKWIKFDANGVSSLRSFMEYATTKKPLEFIKDLDNPTAIECVLESTSLSRSGTGFRLIENQRFRNYYSSGRLVFRSRAS